MVLEAIGGVWPASGASYDSFWRSAGPSYLPGALRLASNPTARPLIRYDACLSVAAWLPADSSVPPYTARSHPLGGGLSWRLGGLEDAGGRFSQLLPFMMDRSPPFPPTPPCVCMCACVLVCVCVRACV